MAEMVARAETDRAYDKVDVSIIRCGGVGWIVVSALVSLAINRNYPDVITLNSPIVNGIGNVAGVDEKTSVLFFSASRAVPAAGRRRTSIVIRYNHAVTSRHTGGLTVTVIRSYFYLVDVSEQNWSGLSSGFRAYSKAKVSVFRCSVLIFSVPVLYA